MNKVLATAKTKKRDSPVFSATKIEIIIKTIPAKIAIQPVLRKASFEL